MPTVISCRRDLDNVLRHCDESDNYLSEQLKITVTHTNLTFKDKQEICQHIETLLNVLNVHLFFFFKNCSFIKMFCGLKHDNGRFHT